MQNVTNKLRVVHFPQVGSCRKSFTVEVKDEQEAYKIMTVLANQHLWLEKNRIIPDYSNAIFVEMWDDDIDGEGTAGWCDYNNFEECMDWREFEEEYLSNKVTG